MGSVDQDKAISKIRCLGGESKAHEAAPIMADDIGVGSGNTVALGRQKGFSHGHDEFSQSFQNPGVGCIKAVASTIARKVDTDNGCLSSWYGRFLQHVPPHHTAVGEAMEEDEQVARLLLAILISDVV